MNDKIAIGNTAEDIMERLMNHKRLTPTERICENFYNDVVRYLTSKLKGFPEHEIMDIATFCGNRMMVTANDLLFERDREWREEIQRDKNRKARMRRAAEMNYGDKED